MAIPKKYQDLVGTKQLFSGGLFTHKRDEPQHEYDVLDVRWGSATIVNMKEIQETGESSYEHPSIEYLIKNNSMKRSRWTRPFPVREINLKEKISNKKTHGNHKGKKGNKNL